MVVSPNLRTSANSQTSQSDTPSGVVHGPQESRPGIGALAAAAAIAVGVSNANAATTSPSASATGYATGAPSAATGTAATGDRGGGGSTDTPVTGDEATKASDAVTAEDSAVTVTSVRKDPDGSYDVLGTKAGAPVMFDVTADLGTVTQSANGGPGGGGGQAATGTV